MIQKSPVLMLFFPVFQGVHWIWYHFTTTKLFTVTFAMSNYKKAAEMISLAKVRLESEKNSSYRGVNHTTWTWTETLKYHLPLFNAPIFAKTLQLLIRKFYHLSRFVSIKFDLRRQLYGDMEIISFNLPAVCNYQQTRK